MDAGDTGADAGDAGGQDLCAPDPCNEHASACTLGMCTCVTGYGGTFCARCAEGYSGYPNCQRQATCASPEGARSSATFRSSNVIYGTPVRLTDNGGWSWFENERAIIANGHLFASTVATSAGAGGGTRRGHVEINSLNLTTLSVARHVMGEGVYFEPDDHNSAALWMRPDNRLVAVYARHALDHLIRYAISAPGAYGMGDWSPERQIDARVGTIGGNVTYSNLYFLSSVGSSEPDDSTPGRLYNIYRNGSSRYYMRSDDWGESWTLGGVLMHSGGHDPERRFANPYHQFASNGTDEIHYVFNDAHPRVPGIHNRVYHVVIRDGRIRRSDGAPFQFLSDVSGSVTEDPIVYSEVAGTVSEVWRPNFPSIDDGWVSDLALSEEGSPHLAFSAQVDGCCTDAGLELPFGTGGFDLRYFYARWDEGRWKVNEMAFAGTRLYASEEDYSGNVALHPDRSDTLFISTDVHPETQAQLIGPDGKRHYEIFLGRTEDRGATWSWTPVTFNSSTDNIRPFVPSWNRDHTVLAWMRGRYPTFTSYDTSLEVLLDPAVPTPRPVLRVDFGAAGQTVQEGFVAFTRKATPDTPGEQSESYPSCYAALGGEIGVTVGGGNIMFRTRATSTPGPVRDLADDFAFLDDQMTLTVSNLVADDYHLVLYGHDSEFGQRQVAVLHRGSPIGMLTPTTGARPEGINPEDPSGFPVGVASMRTTVVSDGTQDIVLTFHATGKGGNHIVLNGFELYALHQSSN